MAKSGLPGLTVSPGFTKISVMVPAIGALISVSIFIASKIKTIESASTTSPREAIALKILPPKGASII